MVKRSEKAAKKVGENLDKLLAGKLPTRKKEPKLYKIKFIKDTEKFKIGEEASASKKSAAAINNGYAEYVEEEKIKKIYSRCIEKRPNQKDNIWLHVEYNESNDMYRVMIILEDGRTKLYDNKEHISIWQKKGWKNVGEFDLEQGCSSLGLDPDFFDWVKLDKEVTKAIRNFCSSDDKTKEEPKPLSKKITAKLISKDAEDGRKKNPKIQELQDEVKKYKEEGSPRIEQEEIKQLTGEDVQDYISVWAEQGLTPITFEQIKRVSEMSSFSVTELKGFVKEQTKKEETKDEASIVFSRRTQIEAFWKRQPFYYDRSKIFWLWDKDEFKWLISDEIDFCNSLFKLFRVDTIDGKTRAEIVEGFRQVGRLHEPEKVKKSWVQFKEKIYDLETEETFNATPKYFVTNPIPWKLGDIEDTITIDKYFSDWMKGQDDSWKNTLYEIIAYNVSSNKFMQRVIALVGGGSNGKGTYIKLNQKFLGKENCVSSELKNLSEDKFEPAVLYRKLLCVMGEVSYDDLKNTNQLKKLGGEDDISFQFKGKTPFTDENTATCICLTNSMPNTPDKTVGFYRKWLIIDFINQFKTIDKDLIKAIPDIEFENLALKCFNILKRLYKKPHFTNEGDFNEREKRYEERSNPVMKFVEEKCEQAPMEMISLRNFTINCNAYLKSKHLMSLNAIRIGKILRDEGFLIGVRKINDASCTAIIDLKFKDHQLGGEYIY